MRLATVIVALLVALPQGFLGAAEMTTPSADGRWAVLFAAAVLTGAGTVLAATGPLERRGTIGLTAIALAQFVACGLIVQVLWQEWSDAPAVGLDGLVVALLGIGLLASACVAFGGASAWRPSPGRAGALGLAGGLLLLGGGAVAAGAVTNVSRLGCGRFVFDRERWSTDESRIAPTLARCGTLEGHTRGEVRAMLGSLDPTAWGLDVEYADGRVRDVRFRGVD